MPIEIGELVISATIITEDRTGAASGSTPAAAPQKDDLIRECVEQVMEIIRQQNQR